MVQSSAELESVALFRIDGGLIAGPVMLPVRTEIVPGGKTQSMESRIQETLFQLVAAPAHTSTERMEHLAILKRWYYRSSRLGEIFFADDKGNFPLRRIVRGVARVYKGEKPEAELTPGSPSGALHDS